ncbi:MULTISPECIES: helix-turn-helix domain-containing protein [unclassified Enterococcus]|uniref:helix-turn-helix domain-containing protein n=1 Tax=unclassified Enterococcus TaxID=2608891 RepID=UPI001CE1689D|nr:MULTISPECIES: helix-turn-helix domain-containing protein [unclassified Enterococcus]MCA5013643.1 helix-turn-helix domain-containing protein [Enterococcus sp. S23]MCA5016893.1 helix-turn-helix domain-containing protein [Enterococcus sp. S22(2020)]
MIRNNLGLILFDKEARTKVQLISHFDRSKQWWTMEELVEETGMTKRTIEKYLLLIQEELTVYDPTGESRLIYDKHFGCSLHFKDSGEIESFLLFIMQNTLCYQLTYAIFFENISSAVQFAQENYTSESTIWRMIRDFREILQQYDLDIQKGSFQLIGDEYQIRKFAHSVIWNLFKGKQWPFSQVAIQRVDQILNSVEAFFKVELSTLKRQSMAYFIATCLTRNQNGHSVKWSVEVKENTENNELFQEFSECLKEHFEESVWSTAEAAFMFSAVLTVDDCYRDPEIEKRIYDFHEINNTALYQSIVSLRKVAEEHLDNIELSEIEVKHLTPYAFSSHIFCQIFKGFEFSNTRYNYWNRIQLKYPVLISKLASLIDLLAEQTGEIVFFQKNFLIPRYLLMYAFIGRLSQFEKQIRVVLITNLPVLEEERVIVRLDETYKNDYNLEVIQESALNDTEYQLVLSTSKVPKEKIGDVPNLIFNTELTKVDYAELDKVLWQIVKER